MLKINKELSDKINSSNVKYQQLFAKIKEKKENNKETILTKQIKELETEIQNNMNSSEKLKKEIDNLKAKVEFNEHLEKSAVLNNKLKEENLKNYELQNEYKFLSIMSSRQKRYLNQYEQKNQVSEKMRYLKNEIKLTKEKIKESNEKYTSRDKFIKIAHEKILDLQMYFRQVKNKNTEKEKKKEFSIDELKECLDSIERYKNKIKDNRNYLDAITKAHNNKLHQHLVENKKIENKYIESEKLNKSLIIKKNEIKRNIEKLKLKLDKKDLENIEEFQIQETL